MSNKDLNGEFISDGDWYYSICRGTIVAHKYIKNWAIDERRIDTGRVIKANGIHPTEEALNIFRKKNVWDTIQEW